jgi:hypothetical protein
MALGTAALIAGGISAAGGIAGALGKKNSQMDWGNYNKSRGVMDSATSGYQSALQNEFAQGSAGQMDFANMLKQYAQDGGIPNGTDVSRANSYAKDMFGSRRIQQAQNFQDQLTSANRQAAMSGRGVNDPILRAKLAQEQTRQADVLGAEQQGFAAQFAMQQPGQRLGYMGQRADTLVSRGQNALGAQQNLFNMGQAGAGSALQAQGMSFQEQQAQVSPLQRIGGVLSSIGGGIGSAMGVQSSMQGMDFMKSLTNSMSSPQSAPQGLSQSFVGPSAQPFGPQRYDTNQAQTYSPFVSTTSNYAPGASTGGWGNLFPSMPSMPGMRGGR